MSNKQKNQPAPPAALGVEFRLGGAFFTLGIVLVALMVLQIFTVGWLVPFAVTLRFLMLCVAAMLVGAAANVRTKADTFGKGSFIAIIIALILVVVGRFVPNEALTYMQQYWLAGYAVVTITCGIVLRATAARKIRAAG